MFVIGFVCFVFHTMRFTMCFLVGVLTTVCVSCLCHNFISPPQSMTTCSPNLVSASVTHTHTQLHERDLQPYQYTNPLLVSPACKHMCQLPTFSLIHGFPITPRAGALRECGGLSGPLLCHFSFFLFFMSFFMFPSEGIPQHFSQHTTSIHRPPLML